MRIESSVTSVSWIPSESVSGVFRTGFAIGASRFDDPPPEVLRDLDALFAAERFRFANRLAAWIEVSDGRITGAGYKVEYGDDIYLLLDGVLSIWVDGTQVGELGPGAVVGERAALGDGRRTATLRAVTGCVIAAAASSQVDRASLASLAEGHHREDARS